MRNKTRLAFIGLALVALSVLDVAPALAAGRLIMCNAIGNAKVVSLKVKGGTVTGFKAIPPRKCLAVTVKTGDGKCKAWVYAHISSGSVSGQPAATGLLNTCGGKYMVNLRVEGNSGTSSNLNITPIK